MPSAHHVLDVADVHDELRDPGQIRALRLLREPEELRVHAGVGARVDDGGVGLLGKLGGQLAQRFGQRLEICRELLGGDRAVHRDEPLERGVERLGLQRGLEVGEVVANAEEAGDLVGQRGLFQVAVEAVERLVERALDVLGGLGTLQVAPVRGLREQPALLRQAGRVEQPLVRRTIEHPRLEHAHLAHGEAVAYRVACQASLVEQQHREPLRLLVEEHARDLKLEIVAPLGDDRRQRQVRTHARTLEHRAALERRCLLGD